MMRRNCVTSFNFIVFVAIRLCLSRSLRSYISNIVFHAVSGRICFQNLEYVLKRITVFACYFPTAWANTEDVEEVFQILHFRLANVSREGTTPLLGGDFNACIGPVENHDYFDFYKDHGEWGAKTSEKPILFILFWGKEFGSAIARWLWNMCMTVLMVLWYNPISLSLITKGSVSYLSSPCFSTFIGGIGGPALIKRRIVGVVYKISIIRGTPPKWSWVQFPRATRRPQQRF